MMERCYHPDFDFTIMRCPDCNMTGEEMYQKGQEKLTSLDWILKQ